MKLPSAFWLKLGMLLASVDRLVDGLKDSEVYASEADRIRCLSKDVKQRMFEAQEAEESA